MDHPGTGHGELVFVGTATTLLRFGPFTLLTDPNFLRRGQRAYLGWGLTSKRLTDPAIAVEDLPELDAVLLSHLHGDHWDRVAEAALDHELPVLTTPHGGAYLRRRGFAHARGLRNWDDVTLAKDGGSVRVTSVPGRHAFGALGMLLPPVMGSIVDFLGPSGEVRYRVYVTGDTLMFDGVREIPERYPDIDLLVIHLGGTRIPAGRALPGALVTMDGHQGVEFLREIGARHTVPIHYDDYGVFASPLSDFQREVAALGFDGLVNCVARGGSLALSAPARHRSG
ncbi:MAG: hypothetical protein QOJ50_3955 [Cryptosporangiaceae bacterium]|nr:hypothetical protein [Cryptosporangiaceae bacterium]